MWMAEKRWTELIKYRSLQELPNAAMSLITTSLGCEDVVNLCLANSSLCEKMKEIDFEGEEHERKMFKDFARCILKEANITLRDLEHNYPIATHRVAKGDDMWKVLGRVIPGTSVNIIDNLALKEGRRQAQKVKVLRNLFRENVAEGIADGDYDLIYEEFPNIDMMDMPPEVPIGRFEVDTSQHAWIVEYDDGTTGPMDFSAFTIFEYVDYDRFFTMSMQMISIHAPKRYGVHMVPLEQYERGLSKVYRAIALLLGVEGKLSFRIAKSRNDPTNDFEYFVFFDNKFPEFPDEDILLTLPIFSIDKEYTQYILKSVTDDIVSEWGAERLVVERLRSSKRRKKSRDRS